MSGITLEIEGLSELKALLEKATGQTDELRDTMEQINVTCLTLRAKIHQPSLGAPAFTLEDYKEGLRRAGPKLTEDILKRAAEDPHIGYMSYKELADLVYPGDVL